MEDLFNPFDLFNFNLNLGAFLGKIGVRSLLFIIAIEEVGVPLPISGDLFLLTAGRNSLHLNFGLERIIFATVIGTILGSSLLYLISRTLGRALVIKYGRYLRIEEESLNKVEGWFQKHGGAAIMVGRLFPGFRVASTIVAGIMEVHYFIFLFYTVLATIIWASAFFLAGRFLGRHFEILWRDILSRPYLTLLGTIIGMSFLVWFLRRIAGGNNKKNN